MEFLIFLVVGCIITGAIGAYVGRTKGRQTEGMLFGILLGPLGWIIVLLMPENKSSHPSGLPADYLRKREAMNRNPSGPRKAADEAWNKAINGE